MYICTYIYIYMCIVFMTVYSFRSLQIVHVPCNMYILVAERTEELKNWGIQYKTRHLKVLAVAVHDLLPHHTMAERYNAAGIMPI